MIGRFFFACAGIFLLALSYHFGAGTAISQSSTEVGGVRFGATIGLVAATNGDVYRDDHTVDGTNPQWTLRGHIPTTAPIVALGNESDNYVLAYASNGDFFSSSDFGASWELRGNVFNSTPVRIGSWGHLKNQYRK